MDRIQHLSEGGVYFEAIAERPGEARDDLGVWFFRWFGAGVGEHWLASSHWAAVEWLDRTVDGGLSSGG